LADSPFWRFSLGFYALPDVAPACIRLQDEGGADVNLLLFLLFVAESRSLVTEDDIIKLDHMIAPWREDAVKLLRQLRRRLKEGIPDMPPAMSETFRTQIKKLELESERLEQALLEREGLRLSFAVAPTREAAAAANLEAYGAFRGGLPPEPLKIVLRAFTNSPP
jgi:uncharacterized protein (TIGR02444 family)